MTGSIEEMASKFVKEDLPSEKCIEGAKYIIAEWISVTLFIENGLEVIFIKTE